MHQLEIELAKVEDGAFLLEMLILSLKSLPQVAIKSAVEIEGMARLELGGWETERDYAFVARLNQQQAGAVWLKAQGELTARYFTLGIAVAPEFQGRKVGTALLEYALDYCKRNQGSSVSLKVHPTNLPALQLYRRLGFEEISLELKKKF